MKTWGGCHLQAKGHLQVAEARTEAWNQFSLRSLKSSCPADTLPSDCQPPELRESNFLSLKPPSFGTILQQLWPLVSLSQSLPLLSVSVDYSTAQILWLIGQVLVLLSLSEPLSLTTLKNISLGRPPSHQ